MDAIRPLSGVSFRYDGDAICWQQRANTWGRSPDAHRCCAVASYDDAESMTRLYALWFVHSNDVSLREQIVQQVSLGVLSGELAPGERLPSIRALARRFRMHANTVSAAYRQLHDQQWVCYRRGSGVYV